MFLPFILNAGLNKAKSIAITGGADGPAKLLIMEDTK